MRNISKINGLKGGRRTYNINIRFEIPNIHFVIITPEQYNSLLEKYGYELLIKAISILDEWLQRNKSYEEKNCYWYFRKDGWVINEAKYLLKK